MKHFYFLLFIAFVAAGWSNNHLKVVRINRTIDSLTAVFRPDARTAVFSVAVEKNDNPEAKTALLSRLRQEIAESPIDSVRVLPNSSLDSKVYGIVDVSVGNVRAVPKSAEELVNQVLMGHIVRILKETRGWLCIKSEDDYLGWIEPGDIVTADSSTIANYAATRKLVVEPVFAKQPSFPATREVRCRISSWRIC